MQIINGLKHTKMRSVVGRRPDSLGKLHLQRCSDILAAVGRGKGRRQRTGQGVGRYRTVGREEEDEREGKGR